MRRAVGCATALLAAWLWGWERPAAYTAPFDGFARGVKPIERRPLPATRELLQRFAEERRPLILSGMNTTFISFEELEVRWPSRTD